jgi:CheY-like chemotaxis protein
MTRMLQRILGEDVALNADYAPGLPLVHADPSMIEQVLLNLAVNSRDAMPQGGRLSVSTGVETMDEAAAHQHPGIQPGQFVRLSVSDTGSGIAPEHLSHIFEPFFTTKEIGKGTGLGLATVYGIVKQHRGWIGVDSTPAGATFHIHLPAIEGSAAREKASPATALPRGTETILVVEDEPSVRLLADHLLQRHGYTVLTAVSGVAALDVWREHRDHIHLLLTDMIMPDGMTGYQLAETLLAEKPDLKVIFTSGYSADVVGKGSALVEGENFLQKPYHAADLIQSVRRSLDGH